MADFPSRGGYRGKYGNTRVSRSSKFSYFGCLGVAVVGVLVVSVLSVIAVIGFYVYGLTVNSTAQDCVVVEKDRTRTENGSDMRIYTENCGTLQVADTIIGKVNFNSADLYARIEVGKTYDFQTRGVRVGFLSMFPLILEATEVK